MSLSEHQYLREGRREPRKAGSATARLTEHNEGAWLMPFRHEFGDCEMRQAHGKSSPQLQLQPPGGIAEYLQIICIYVLQITSTTHDNVNAMYRLGTLHSLGKIITRTNVRSGQGRQ